MVANGAMTEAALILTYSSIVSRDIVCLDFLIYGLNDLDIMVCYVGNAYLNSPCQDNIWFAEGPEHVLEKTGKVMVMVRDLYE